jgi:hypothetical protein
MLSVRPAREDYTWRLTYYHSDIYRCWFDMIDFVMEHLGYKPITMQDLNNDTRIIFFETEEERNLFLLRWSHIDVLPEN